jgi:hypothetical protein
VTRLRATRERQVVYAVADINPRESRGVVVMD